MSYDLENVLEVLKTYPVKRFRTSYPKIGHFCMWIIWAENDQGPKDLGRPFYLPLNYLK